MTTSETSGRLRSGLGEHLVVLLIVAAVIVGAITFLSALEAEAHRTADRAQERVDLPLVIASDKSAP